MSGMAGMGDVKVSYSSDECYDNAMYSKATFLLTLLH